jgi:hypothetical protein
MKPSVILPPLHKGCLTALVKLMMAFDSTVALHFGLLEIQGHDFSSAVGMLSDSE